MIRTSSAIKITISSSEILIIYNSLSGEKKSLNKFAFSVASVITLLLELSEGIVDLLSGEMKYFKVDHQPLDVRISDFNFSLSLSI